MHLNNAEVPHGIMAELAAALGSMPADEPRNDLQ
jgi:hypothetical protein